MEKFLIQLRNFALSALIIILLTSCANTQTKSQSPQAGLEITSAVVHLPGMAMSGMDSDTNLAGYMVIKNTGSTDDNLIGIQADFAMAMLHQTIIDANGVASMKEVAKIPVPSGQTVELKPGGYHIMFMSPMQNLKAGDIVKITLQFQNAGSVIVQANVTDQ